MRFLLIVIGCLLSLFISPSAAQSESAPSDTSAAATGTGVMGTIKDFSFNVNDQDGHRKAIIKGDEAHILQDGIIQITNVDSTVFLTEQQSARILSMTASYDKRSSHIKTDQYVEIDYANMHIAGLGCFWTPEHKKIRIYQNVKTVINNTDTTRGIAL